MSVKETFKRLAFGGEQAAPITIDLYFKLHQDGTVYQDLPSGIRRVDSPEVIKLVYAEYERLAVIYRQQQVHEQRKAKILARLSALLPKEVDPVKRKA